MLFSRKGDRIAYTSTKRNGRDNDIYVMNPEDPSSGKMVYEANGAWFPADWSGDDNKLLIVKYVSANETYPHVLNISSGKAEPLFPTSKSKLPTLAEPFRPTARAFIW